MGNARSKQPSCKSTGMTLSECRLVQETWHAFCNNNSESGVLIFGAFLTQNTHLLPLFRRFRAMPLQMLTSDPAFRAHACSVAYQITAMVNNADDPVLLEALIRKNALAHTTREGVFPQHFETLARVIVDVMQSKDQKKQLTPSALAAWKKLLEFMITVTSNVYQNEGIKSEGMLSRRSSSQSETLSEECPSAYETCTSGERNPTAGDAIKASSSVQLTPSRETLSARSKGIARDSRGAAQANRVSVKPEQQSERNQREPAPSKPTRRSSDAEPVAPTSSYIAPDASATTKITVMEAASDKPHVFNKSALVPSASSSIVIVSRRVSANAELATDSGIRFMAAKDANVVQSQESVASVNKAELNKGSLQVDAASATYSARDEVKPCVCSVSAQVQPATIRETREGGSSESRDVGAPPETRLSGSDQSDSKKNHNVTAEKRPSMEAPPPLSSNVYLQSADTQQVLRDYANEPATAEKGGNTGSGVTPRAPKKGKSVQPPA